MQPERETELIVSANHTLFVGFGSDHGDDFAGWLAADLLRIRIGSAAEVRRAAAPIDMLDWLGGIERLAICDACQGGGPVGSWQRSLWPTPGLSQSLPRGSHDLGLSEVVRLAEKLGMLPGEVLFWGVEIRSAQPGGAISPEVAAAVPAVVDDVALVLEHCHA